MSVYLIFMDNSSGHQFGKKIVNFIHHRNRESFSNHLHMMNIWLLIVLKFTHFLYKNFPVYYQSVPLSTGSIILVE